MTQQERLGADHHAGLNARHLPPHVRCGGAFATTITTATTTSSSCAVATAALLALLALLARLVEHFEHLGDRELPLEYKEERAVAHALRDERHPRRHVQRRLVDVPPTLLEDL